MVVDSDNIDRRNFLGLMIGGAVMGAVDPKGLLPYVDPAGSPFFTGEIQICTGFVSNPIVVMGSGLIPPRGTWPGHPPVWGVGTTVSGLI